MSVCLVFLEKNEDNENTRDIYFVDKYLLGVNKFAFQRSLFDFFQ